MRLRLPAFLLLTIATLGASAQEIDTPSFDPADFVKDLEILESALLELHPGLDRYGRRPVILEAFRDLRVRADSLSSLRQAYVELSRLLAQIQRGHTYANYWNQPDEIQERLFHQSDKLPFTFDLLTGTMVIRESAVDDERLGRGVQIESINGVSVETILEALLPLVSADGANDGQRLHALRLSGVGDYEPFDVLYPLVFPSLNRRLQIVARDTAGVRFELETETMSRDLRGEVLAARSGAGSAKPDDLWRFAIEENGVAYLRLGTFVTWKMEMDWKAFLRDAFSEMQEKGVEDLILDLRGNAGGADEVNSQLLRYLVTRPVRTPGGRQLVRYQKVSARLLPYLDTWDDSIKDVTRKVEPADDGFFVLKGPRPEGRLIRPSDDAFQGRVYLLVDAANSSATFILARLLKESGLATLVGQETGGNLKGTNGGQLFFLRLPNTGLEVDVPLIGSFPMEEQQDGGLLPDVEVEATAADIAMGRDPTLARARQLIADARQGGSP